MHYVDEGRGPPILMIHGTPTWSFLYRHLIRHFSQNHRVVACDHIGFGLSDKPEGWTYRPEDHAKNVEQLIDELGLSSLTLVVHDFGGPIGLAYALRHPQEVHALVLFNTWMWSLAGTPAEWMSRVMSSRLGRFLYLRMNFSPRVLLRVAFGDRRKLTARVHAHYLEPFPSSRHRHGTWALARELLGSSAWYESLWESRERIAGKPCLLLWGMRDPAFKADALRRWESVFSHARVVRLGEVGHFVPEEAPSDAATEMEAFLADLSRPTFS